MLRTDCLAERVSDSGFGNFTFQNLQFKTKFYWQNNKEMCFKGDLRCHLLLLLQFTRLPGLPYEEDRYRQKKHH